MSAKKEKLDSLKQAFEKYLLRGNDIETAKSKAGINDDDIVIECISEMHAKGSHEAHHEIEAAQIALSTLKDLCYASNPEVRCAAARSLLQYVSGKQKNRTTERAAEKNKTIALQLPETLWDFSP